MVVVSVLAIVFDTNFFVLCCVHLHSKSRYKQTMFDLLILNLLMLILALIQHDCSF